MAGKDRSASSSILSSSMRPTKSAASCAAQSGARCPAAALGATSFVGSKVFAEDNAKVEDAWGANLHKLVDRRFNHMLIYGIIGEDLPEESNHVVLDPRLTDSDGIPAPKIIYKVSENSDKMLRFHVAR